MRFHYRERREQGGPPHRAAFACRNVSRSGLVPVIFHTTSLRSLNHPRNPDYPEQGRFVGSDFRAVQIFVHRHEDPVLLTFFYSSIRVLLNYSGVRTGKEGHLLGLPVRVGM